MCGHKKSANGHACPPLQTFFYQLYTLLVYSHSSPFSLYFVFCSCKVSARREKDKEKMQFFVFFPSRSLTCTRWELVQGERKTKQKSKKLLFFFPSYRLTCAKRELVQTERNAKKYAPKNVRWCKRQSQPLGYRKSDLWSVTVYVIDYQVVSGHSVTRVFSDISVSKDFVFYGKRI